MTRFLALAILASSLAAVAGQAMPRAAARVCVFPKDKVASCRAVMTTVTGAAITCVGADDAQACTDLVAAGGADATKLEGDNLYKAGTSDNLVPLLSEYYGSTVGASYFSVAVVTKAFCDSRPKATMADLRGARSCHTGYRKTAGWTVPVGFLVAQGIMPVVDLQPGVQADAQTVAAFFSETCAPRYTKDGPKRGGGAWPGLCTGCRGNCSEASPFGDYSGALRCLMEGAGDVAFIKEGTPRDFAKGGPKAEAWSTLAASDLRLLCPAGGCAAINMYDSCNLARVPAYAFMTTPAFRSSEAGKAVAAALAAASMVPGFRTRAIDAGLLGPDTTELKVTNQDFSEYFGASTLKAYASMSRLKDARPSPAAASSMPSPATPAALTGGDDAGAAEVGDMAPKEGPRGGGLGGGAIAGIVVGVLAAVALALAGGVWALRRRRSTFQPSFQAYSGDDGGKLAHPV